MLLREDLLSSVLLTYPQWAINPEQFLKFITLVSDFSTIDLETEHQLTVTCDMGKELAAIFMKVFDVNIDPYEDFAELRSHFFIEVDLRAEIAKMYKKSTKDDALFEMLEQADMLPSLQTIATVNAEELLIQLIIEKLKPHIRFY